MGAPDPEGGTPPDDHFDHEGNYLYTDDKETNNIIIHKSIGPNIPNIGQPEMQIELKDYLFYNNKDYEMLTNIAAHYASFAGVDVNNLHNGKFSIAAAVPTSAEGGIVKSSRSYFNDGIFRKASTVMSTNFLTNAITIQIYNRHVHYLLNDKFNFISSLYHEGGETGHLGLPKAIEKTIIMNQMLHPTFFNTTQDYKEAMMIYYLQQP